MATESPKTEWQKRRDAESARRSGRIAEIVEKHKPATRATYDWWLGGGRHDGEE